MRALKYLVFCITFITLYIPCKSQENLTETLNAEYEQHFISSGNNFPDISLKKNNRYKFLVGLHNGFDPNEIKDVLGWSEEDLQSEIDLLTENGYLKAVDNKLFPAISIVMQEEGAKMFSQSARVADSIVQSILQIEPAIRQAFNTMGVSKHSSYADFKFFLFSDVLLDNWQINNVEDAFLKKERPLRHGKRYYIQYAEKDTLQKREVFGIYGNQYSCNDSVCYIIYGNNRVNNKKSQSELDSMDIPVLSIQDQEILENMANAYKPILLEILERNKDYFLQNYTDSAFQNEISFEEYFIWYYHFLYTKATDSLADKNVITIPESGVFRVILEK